MDIQGISWQSGCCARLAYRDTPAQILCTMKLHKQTKSVARNSNSVGISMPAANSPQGLQEIAPNNPLLTTDAGPSDELDSQDQLELRAFIKHNLPRFKASNSLLDKIRNSISED